MKLHALLCSSFCVVAFSVATLAAAEVNLEGIKCPISNRDAVAGTDVEHNGGKVFFCCNNCPNAFRNDTARFAAKANAQLVSTKQAEQAACPFSGRDLDPETAIEVAGVKVAFCCGNCQARAEEAEGDEQLNMVLGDTAFKKGFVVAAD